MFVKAYFMIKKLKHSWKDIKMDGFKDLYA